MITLFSIKNNGQYEETIKYSKFISFIFRINSKEEILSYLNKIKKEYPNADHYCYGYIIDDQKKFSDDNEPSKTAGYPILKQIEGHNLNYTLIIVVRYFGGIKLGTGLLTRTYSKMASEVIKNSSIISLVKGYNISISFNYSEIKNVSYLLNNSQIIDKTFDDNVTYKAIVSKETLEKLYKYQMLINKETYIEKE